MGVHVYDDDDDDDDDDERDDERGRAPFFQQHSTGALLVQ